MTVYFDFRVKIFFFIFSVKMNERLRKVPKQSVNPIDLRL